MPDLEDSLFDWIDAEEVDPGLLQFGSCTLKVPIGDNQVGTHFDFIILNLNAGKLTLGSAESGFEETYEIHLAVGKRIK